MKTDGNFEVVHVVVVGSRTNGFVGGGGGGCL